MGKEVVSGQQEIGCDSTLSPRLPFYPAQMQKTESATKSLHLRQHSNQEHVYGEPVGQKEK